MKSYKMKIILFSIFLLMIMFIGCKKGNNIKENPNNENIDTTIINGTNTEIVNNVDGINERATEEGDRYKLAALALDKETYTNKETINLKINNFGDDYLLTTGFYKIEKLNNDKWEEVPSGLKFSENIIKIEYLFEQGIGLSNLEDGEYKISKEIDAYSAHNKEEFILNLVLEKEFTIKNK